MEASEIVHRDLLNVPEELFYGYLFPYLKLNDLLRLRRVCKQIKIYSDDYIRNHFTSQEIEINESDHTLTEFINLDLPLSHIYLNNSSGLDFFESPKIVEFLQSYAATITHLRVKSFSTCVSNGENYFYLQLTNLRHLELKTIDLTTRYGGKVETSKTGENHVEVVLNKYFPRNFRNLTTLKLNKLICTNRQDYVYIKDLIEFCPKLEFLRHPHLQGCGLFEPGAFDCITAYIQRRHREFPNEPNLKFYDLQHYKEESMQALQYFRPFVKLCYSRGVQLLNVNAIILELVWTSPVVQTAFDMYLYSFPILSMINVRQNLFRIDLPCVERVLITQTSKCTYRRISHYRDVPRWLSIKSIDITIDSEHLLIPLFEGFGIEMVMQQTPTSELLKFLFATSQREFLTELSIRDPDEYLDLPCPRASDIVRTCGNVTMLKLANWLGTSKEISRFWSGLPLLEEVVLEDCEMMGDEAFLGEDKEAPTFLKLKKLRKLTLNGLDRMPKVTDVAFDLVFRHLAIRQFYLNSTDPIKSVTINGIRSLLSGEFNNCVEKFPFHGWSLKNISEEQFSQLKSEFRSTSMV